MLEQFKKQMVSDVIRYGQMGFKFIESEHPRNESGEFSSGNKSGLDNVSSDDTIGAVSGVSSEASKKGEKMKETHEMTRQEYQGDVDWREAGERSKQHRAAVEAAKEAGKSFPREVMEDYPSLFHAELESFRNAQEKEKPAAQHPKMTPARKESLVSALRSAQPKITIRTQWTMGDFDHDGIEIHSRDASTGNTLNAVLTDAELEAMSDADVLAWASSAVANFRGRQKRTRRAVAAEREMDRE